MTPCVWTMMAITMCVGAICSLSLVRIAGICSQEDERWPHDGATATGNIDR